MLADIFGKYFCKIPANAAAVCSLPVSAYQGRPLAGKNFKINQTLPSDTWGGIWNNLQDILKNYLFLTAIYS